jgi:hypothetical protein
VISHVLFDGDHPMQAIKSLFSRAQVQAAAAVPAQQPVELSFESLKLVGGGLPRVSGTAAVVVDTSRASYELPRVS